MDEWRRVAVTSLLVILALVSSLTFASALRAETYMRMPIDEIYDGDTIQTHVNTYRLPEPLNSLSIRIYGIDTPENPAKSYRETGKLGRAACVKEAEAALKAKQFVVDMAAGQTFMVVRNFQWDKYGGRVLATVEINGKNVADELVKAGLAIPYFGEAKTHDWCSE